MHSILISALGLAVGGGAGYLFHQWTGCSSGACLLAAFPTASVLMGMLIGFTVAQAISGFWEPVKQRHVARRGQKFPNASFYSRH